MKAYRLLLVAAYANRVAPRVTHRDIQSVLIVRGDGGIGDFVLFLPSLRALRRHYAGSRISLLVGSESADLASAFAGVDEVISFKVKRYRLDLSYRIRLIRRLRSLHFDLALNPIYSRTPLTDELLYCSGAKERIACAGNLDNIDGRIRAANNRYCTRILPSSEEPLHELARNRKFVERLIGMPVSPQDFQARLPIPESLIRNAAALLRSRGIDPQRDLIVTMFPGASHAIKMWPAERFAKLADRLSDTYGARILLCGSPSDRATGNKISQLVNTPPASVIGDTTLPELGAVLHLSALYVGNDSGPLHIAAAADTPTLCILGGGHFGRFCPYPDSSRHRAVFESMPCYQCGWRCIYDAPHCILDVSLERVWEATRSLMENTILPGRAAGVTLREVQISGA